jgi:protein-S-isoprenylcysteine O-methyltransferase Ste14
VSLAGAGKAFYAWLQVIGLAAFLAITVGRTIQLRRHRHINPIALSLRKRGLLGFVEVILFASVNVWALLVLLYVLPLADQPPSWLFAGRLIDSPLARMAGAILIALAFLIRLAAMAELGDSWRLGLDEKAPGQLVTSGIYGISRNPIYIFLDLWFIGTALINGTTVFLLFALHTIANLHYQILQEEAFLGEVHGPAYEDYRARTPRYYALHRAPSALAQPKTQQGL